MRSSSAFTGAGQQGGVVLRVVMAVATLLVIGGALLIVISANQQSQQVNHRKAQDISEYGLMIALQKLGEQPSWCDGFQKTRYDDGWYRVDMKRRTENGKVILSIVSEGSMGPAATVKEECVLSLNIANGDSTWVRESMQ